MLSVYIHPVSCSCHYKCWVFLCCIDPIYLLKGLLLFPFERNWNFRTFRPSRSCIFSVLSNPFESIFISNDFHPEFSFLSNACENIFTSNDFHPNWSCIIPVLSNSSESIFISMISIRTGPVYFLFLTTPQLLWIHFISIYFHSNWSCKFFVPSILCDDTFITYNFLLCIELVPIELCGCFLFSRETASRSPQTLPTHHSAP